MAITANKTKKIRIEKKNKSRLKKKEIDTIAKSNKPTIALLLKKLTTKFTLYGYIFRDNFIQIRSSKIWP